MRVAPLAVVAVVAVASLARADAKKPTFDDDVLPVLRQHCVGCHGTDKQRGGLNVASLTATMQGGSSGAVVTPGDPDKSRLYTLTAHKEQPVMPPKADKIPDAQLEILRLWIEQGARENAGSKVNVPAKPKVDIALASVGKGRPAGPPPMPLPGKLPQDPPVRGRRPGAVLALAASPWAPLVAVGGPKQVALYHSDTADLLGVLPYPHGQLTSLRFSRNGQYLLAAGGRGGQGGKAVLYRIDTGAVVTEVGASETDTILSADISADQTMIAVGTPTKLVRVYSVADGSVLRETKKHTDWVTAVEFSPDGVLLATGDRSGGVLVWEAATGREFHTLRGHTAAITDVSWRPDSNLLATASEDATVRLWEMENGGNVKTWGAHGGGTSSVRFSMDGRLATTGRDRVAKLWDANGGMQKQFPALPDLGLRAAVTHDNAKVLAGDWAGGLTAWAVADAKVAATFDTNPAPLAERVSAAVAAVSAGEAKQKATADALAAAQAKAKQAGEAFAAAQANANKIAGELAGAQKAVTDHTNTANAANAQVPPAKAEVDKAAAALAALTNKAGAADAVAAATAAAVQQMQSAVAKAPQNPDLAAAAKTMAATALQASNDAAVSRKAVADATAAHQAAVAKHAALVKTVADNQTAAAAAAKTVAAVQPTAKPSADAVPPAKAAADAANAAAGAAQAAAQAAVADLAAAKAKADRLKPAGK